MGIGASPNGQPNVIWIFGDQHRGQSLGCAGDPNLHTPNIDRLAAEGVSFHGVAGTPLCCPFRGSLLTSQYPHRCVPGHEHRLPDRFPTIAQVLRRHGYHTAWFGKWHLDGFKEHRGRAAFHVVPPERRGGFDVWVGYENNNSQYDCWIHGGEGEDAFHERLPGYETDALTDLLIQHLRGRAERHPDTPFFSVLSVQPPHDPYVAPPEWMARHTPGQVQFRPNVPEVPWVREKASRELAGYHAMIENLDWNLGRIRRVLEETGLIWNTHIVFCSDHGDMHGSHGHFRKTSPYEESVRVPMILGGGTPFYGVHTGIEPVFVNHVDIAPTTLGLCGIDPPEEMAGTDYSGYRLPDRRAPEPPDSVFLQFCERTGYGDCVDRPWRGLITRDGWKYAAFEDHPWMLFNLREDPYELVNLAAYGHARSVVQGLNARLGEWIAKTGDTFQLPVW